VSAFDVLNDTIARYAAHLADKRALPPVDLLAESAQREETRQKELREEAIRRLGQPEPEPQAPLGTMRDLTLPPDPIVFGIPWRLCGCGAMTAVAECWNCK
jgi:hypothetical protein